MDPNVAIIARKPCLGNLKGLAAAKGYNYVIDGSNVDDTSDFRPGREALEELEIRSPLKEAGLYKDDIRHLSKELGLFTATKPSYACLATRIPYGVPITPAKIVASGKSGRHFDAGRFYGCESACTW
jgi:uncharacterized protein